GFFLNDELTDFTFKPGIANNYQLIQGKKNLIEPMKRPLSSMTPTIITKDGKLFMIVGTPGGSTIISQLVQVITNVIDFGMNIQKAEDASRIHMQALPNKVFTELHALPSTVAHALRKMGYCFQIGSPYHKPIWGAVTGILINPRTNEIEGAMDFRRPSGAA